MKMIGEKLLRMNFFSGSALLAVGLLFGVAFGVSAAESTFVGMETCVTCHEGIKRHFKNDLHASVEISKKGKEDTASVPTSMCEACHGAGSQHAESGGKRKFIQRIAAENCLKCHSDIKAQLNLQHHHPVLEGRVDCNDCHGFHGEGSRSNSMSALRGSDDKCLKCHKEVKGPYVFEHDAMREGCVSCHNPHGSVQDKMLVAGQTTTCLRCHYDVTTAGAGNLSGGIAHANTPSTTGAAGGGYNIGRGEECIDHHRAVHGSNIWRTFNR